MLHYGDFKKSFFYNGVMGQLLYSDLYVVMIYISLTLEKT